MTLSKPRPVRSPEARLPQSSRSSEVETAAQTTLPAYSFGSSALPSSKLSIRRLTLALLLTAAMALLLTALILYAPATAFIKLKQEKLAILQQTQQTMLSRAQSYGAQAGESSQMACIGEAHRLVDSKPQGKLYAQAQDVLKDCQDTLATLKIRQAQTLADGHQEEAIALVSNIEGSMQPQAIALSRTWTEQILNLAKAAYASGKMQEAQQMLSSITSDNPRYALVQADLQAWKQQWAADTANLEAAKMSLRTDQLDIAQTYVDRITSHPYWQTKLKPVRQELSDRQAKYEQIYAEAQQNLVRQNYSAAELSANALPNAAPWGTHKYQILQQVKSAHRKDNVKAIGFSWLLGALSYGLFSLRFKKVRKGI